MEVKLRLKGGRANCSPDETRTTVWKSPLTDPWFFHSTMKSKSLSLPKMILGIKYFGHFASVSPLELWTNCLFQGVHHLEIVMLIPLPPPVNGPFPLLNGPFCDLNGAIRRVRPKRPFYLFEIHRKTAH